MASRRSTGASKRAQPRTPRKSRGKKTVPVFREGEVERVLALDSSSKACGWSVFDSGELVAYGRFKQSGTGHGERLMHFRLWLLALLTQWHPNVLIYEAPYQGRMKHTFGILSRYVGIIEAAHFEYFAREISKEDSVAAHTVKRAIGARKGADHEANKKIVLLMVNQRYGLNLKYKANDTNKKVSQDDDADAIAVNWAWHALYRCPVGGGE